MNEELGIENPDEYWNKDWREIDANHDGYITQGEIVDAFPEHGLDTLPYYDKDGDGKIHWGEWNGLIEKSKRK